MSRDVPHLLLLCMMLEPSYSMHALRPTRLPCHSMQLPRMPRLPSPMRSHRPVCKTDTTTTESSPKVTIQYCTRCNWMLRSAWMAQELLTTFNGTIAEVALIPDHSGTGCFECVAIKDGEAFLVWSREEASRFPESKELKQRVRDVIDPSRSLGHSDTNTSSGSSAASLETNERGTGRRAVKRLMDLLRRGRRT